VNKFKLLEAGLKLILKFCKKNEIEAPYVWNVTKDNRYYYVDSCGFYKNYCNYKKSWKTTPRGPVIAIMVGKCAHIGKSGACWSYPGYTVDRTPYGVLQHELGHYVGELLDSRTEPVEYRVLDSEACGIEEALTGYCPNTSEYFAEMFRLFVTNPNLLKVLRPLNYAAIRKRFQPVIKKCWRWVLEDAPERTIKATENKIRKVTG